MARWLNSYLGTHLGPWDIEQLPDVWLAIVVKGVNLRTELEEAGLI